jgi:hypothetical protein
VTLEGGEDAQGQGDEEGHPEAGEGEIDGRGHAVETSRKAGALPYQDLPKSPWMAAVANFQYWTYTGWSRPIRCL